MSLTVEAVAAITHAWMRGSVAVVVSGHGWRVTRAAGILRNSLKLADHICPDEYISKKNNREVWLIEHSSSVACGLPSTKSKAFPRAKDNGAPP